MKQIVVEIIVKRVLNKFGHFMQMQITDNSRSKRMLHVNCAQEAHVNQDSHTECCTSTIHGSHTLIKIPTMNATC